MDKHLFAGFTMITIGLVVMHFFFHSTRYAKAFLTGAIIACMGYVILFNDLGAVGGMLIFIPTGLAFIIINLWKPYRRNSGIAYMDRTEVNPQKNSKIETRSE